MIKLIEIKYGIHSKVLNLELFEILNLIPFNKKELTWSVLEIEASGDLGSMNMTMATIEKEIELSSRGKLFSWDDLISMSKLFSDIIDITIVGVNKPEDIPMQIKDDVLYKMPQYVIRFVDSSTVLFHSKDEASFNILKQKYASANILQID